jgi:hypothetical protein
VATLCGLGVVDATSTLAAINRDLIAHLLGALMRCYACRYAAMPCAHCKAARAALDEASVQMTAMLDALR